MSEAFGITWHIFNSDYDWEDTVEGVRRKILGYDKDLMLVFVEFKKGSVGYLHKHSYKQISYLISGSFEVNIDGQKKIQKAGDVYFIPSNIEHGVVALEDGTLIDVFNPYREDFIKS